MRPAARLQAAIDLLARVEAGEPPERAIPFYFRTRRYAGAKDRRAVGETVFGVLRHRAWLAWRGGGAASPRDLVLGWHVWGDGAAPESLAAAWAEERFAPAPPDEAELARLAPPEPGPAPEWALLNCPEWLLPAFRAACGEDTGEVLEALNRPAPLDLRVNTLKSDREAALARLRGSGLEAEPTPLSPLGIRLPAGSAVERHPLLREGAAEVQDEGSQIAALLADAQPGMQVLDLCAGAGGKSLALAAGMQNRGQIFACDIEAGRLERLRPRQQRAGVRNLQVHALEPDAAWPEGLPSAFARVVIDAPCAGSGAWRRRPADRWRYDAADLEAFCVRQDTLLDRGAGLTAPGGRLVYITCSLLPAENEARIAALCARQPGLAPVDHRALWGERLAAPPPAGLSAAHLRLDPARDGCDGFFVCVLERRADAAGT